MKPNLTEIQASFDAIVARAKSEKVRNNLSVINNMLKELVNKRKELPSIADLVINLNRNGLSIAEQSFYNKRSGGNLYRELYDIWAKNMVAPLVLKTTPNPEQTTKIPLAIVKVDELKEITNPTLRYRITLALQQLSNTLNQLDMLKNSVSEASKISPLGDPRSPGNHTSKFTLDRYEVDTVKSFVGDNLDTYFNDDGVLCSKIAHKKDTPLSRPGLKQALLKMCH